VPVVIAAGGRAIRDAELAAHARLEGTARTAAGTAIPGARIVLLDADGNTVAVTTTGPDGSYALTGLPAGDYTVVGSGYPPAASTFTITSGGPHQHEVQLGHPE